MYLTESLIKQLTKEDDIKIVTHLDIESSRGDRKLTAIENLHSLHNLTHLNLRGNHIVRMDGLASLLQLLHLNLADNHIEKIEGFESLSRLSLLDVSGNRIERIPPLKRLAALRIFRIAFNRLFRLDDITALKYLLSLHHLSVKSNPCCDSADPSGVIVFHLPSLLTLDGQDVTPELRVACQKRFNLSEIERVEGVVRSQEIRLAEVESINMSLREQMKGSMASASKLRDTSDRSRKGNEALQDELSTTRELLEKKTSELAKKELLVSELRHKLASYIHDDSAVACDADAVHVQQRLVLKRRMLNDLNQLVGTLTFQSSQLLSSLESLQSQGSAVSDSSVPSSPFSPVKRKPTSDAERRLFKDVERLERFEKNYCARIREVTDVISALPRSDDNESGHAAELRRQNRQKHVLTQDREANLKQLLLAQEELHNLQNSVTNTSPSRVDGGNLPSELQRTIDSRRVELQNMLSDVQSRLSQTIAQRQTLEEEVCELQASSICLDGVSDVILHPGFSDMAPMQSSRLNSSLHNSNSPSTACQSCQTELSEDAQASTVKGLVGALFQICKVAQVEGNFAAAPESVASDVCALLAALQASNDELLQKNSMLTETMQKLSDDNVEHEDEFSRMKQDLDSTRRELEKSLLHISAMENKQSSNAMVLEAELLNAREEIQTLKAVVRQNHVTQVEKENPFIDAPVFRCLKRVADALTVSYNVKDSPEDVTNIMCAHISSVQESIVRLREMHRIATESETSLKLEVSRLEADLETAFQQVSALVDSSVVASKSPARMSNAKFAAMQAAIEKVAEELSIDFGTSDSPDMFADAVCSKLSEINNSNQKLRDELAGSGRSQSQLSELVSSFQLDKSRHMATVSALQDELRQAVQKLEDRVVLSRADAVSQTDGQNHREALDRIAREIFVDYDMDSSSRDIADAVCSQFQDLSEGGARLRSLLQEFADADAFQKDSISSLEHELQRTRDDLNAALLVHSQSVDVPISPYSGRDMRDVNALQKIAQALSFEFSEEADVECVSETVCLEIDGLQESNRRLRELQNSTSEDLLVQKEVVQRLEAELRTIISETNSANLIHDQDESAASFLQEVNVLLDRIAQELSVCRSESDSADAFTNVLCSQVILLKRRLLDVQNVNSELEFSLRDALEKHASAVGSLMQVEARVVELEMRAQDPHEADSDAELQSMLLPAEGTSHPHPISSETGIRSDGTSESHEMLIQLLETLHEAELQRARAEDATAQAVADRESAVRSAEQAIQQSEKQRILLASLQQEVLDMQQAVDIAKSQSSNVVVKQFASSSAMSQALHDKEDRLRLLNSELEAVDKRILNRKGELEGVLRELQQADSRRSDIDRAILTGTNQLLELQSQLQQTGDNLEVARIKMQTILESQEKTLVGLCDSVQLQTHQLKLTEAQLFEKRDELAQLEVVTSDIPRSQAELQKLLEDCDSARKVIEDLEEKRVNLSSELHRLDEEKASLCREMDCISQQLEASKVELGDVKQQVAEDYERARAQLQPRLVHSLSQTAETRNEAHHCFVQTVETCVSLDTEILQLRSVFYAQRLSASKLILSMSSFFSVFSSFCSFSLDESSSGYDLFSKVEQSAAEFYGIVNSIVALESQALAAGVDIPRLESDCLNLVESCQVFLDNVHASSESVSQHMSNVRDAEQQFLRQQRILEDCLSVYDTFREKIGEAESKQTMLQEQNSQREAEMEGSQLRLQQIFQEEHDAKVQLQQRLAELSSILEHIAIKTDILQSLESDSNEKRSELMSLQSQVDQASLSRDDFLESISTCEVRLRSLEKQQSDLLCELSELGTRVLRLNSDVVGLEESKQEAAGQCFTLEKRKLEIADSISPLERQQCDLMSKVSSLERSATSLHSEVTRLEEIKREGESSCSLLASKHEELSQTLQLLDANASSRVASLNEEEKRCTLAIGKLKADIASETSSHRQIIQIKQDLEAQTEVVRSQLNELHGELADCTVSLQTTKEQHQLEIGRLHQLQGAVANEQRVVAEAKEELYGALVASESLNSQLESLIAQMDDKQQEMEVLRSQILEQTEQLSQQRLLVSQATQNKQTIVMEIEDLELRRSALVTDIQNKGHQIASYEERIAICSSKESDLRSMLGSQSISLEKTLAELASANRSRQEIELNCDLLRRQEIELSARLPAIQIEVEEAERELGAVETALSRVRQDFAERDSEVVVRRNQLESMHKEISSLSSQLEGLHSAVSAERTALSIVQTQVQDHRQQVSELKSTIRDKTREADALSSTLAQLQAACAREKEAARAVSVEAGSLASSKDELRRSLDQLDRKHLQSQIDAQQHQAVVSSLARAKDKAEEMLKRTRDEHDAAMLRLEKINSALKEKESCVEVQSNRLEALRAEANDCRHNVDSLRLEKQRMESEYAQARQEFKVCERDLLEAKDDLRRVRREVDDFKERMTQERARLDAATKDIKEREVRLSEAQATFSMDSAALAAAEESITRIQSLADNGADLRHDDEVRTSASLPNITFSESWESFPENGSPSKHIRSSSTLSLKLMRLVRVADSYKNSVASSKMQLAEIQNRLTEHQLQFSGCQAEESRCKKSLADLKEERLSLLSASAGQLQSSEAQLHEVRNRIQQLCSEEQLLLATLKTLQQQCVDSRDQTDRLIAAEEKHVISERQALAASESAIQKRLELEEQTRLTAIRNQDILAEKEDLERQLTDMKSEHSSLADEISTIAKMKAALEGSLAQMSQFVTVAEQKANAATSLHSQAAKSIALLQHESEDLEEKVAALSRIKLQIVENSKQCVLHVETTLSAIQQTMQSSLREDIAASVMPKFESLISSVLADFESIAAAVSVLEKSDSREQPQSVIEAALLAKAEHYQTQIRNAEQRLADVDLKRQEIISQLEEKVSQSGQVVASNRAEAGALQEKAQHLRSQVDQLNEKLALLGTQVVSEKEALLQQEQLRAGLHMECEESYSKLQAERRLCAQLEHTAADLQSQKAAIEQDIAVARAQLQQHQLSSSAFTQQLQVEQQKVLSARQEHDSLRQDVAMLTMGIQDFVSHLASCRSSPDDISNPVELPSYAPPVLQPLLDQLQRMCACVVLATSRQQLEAEQPLASTSDMLIINTEMADLRLRLQALHAQAHEAEQRWRRAEAAAAAAESRLSESSHMHDSAYQSALAQLRDAKDALAFKLDQQQQRIFDVCSRLRSSLSSAPIESSETVNSSRDSIDQLESLLSKVENILLHSSAADTAATPAPMRPQATPLMGGVGASTIASAASTASRFSTPLPHKDNEYLPKGVSRNQPLHGVSGNSSEEAARWLELQLAMCRQEFAAMESRYQHAMESSASWRSEREELLRCIASLNARVAIAEEGSVVRAAAARDDELKQALKAMERRLEMRQNLGSLASRVKNECISDLRQKLGMADH